MYGDPPPPLSQAKAITKSDYLNSIYMDPSLGSKSLLEVLKFLVSNNVIVDKWKVGNMNAGKCYGPRLYYYCCYH